MANRYSLKKPKYPKGCKPLDAPSELIFMEPNTTKKSEMDFNGFVYGILKKEPYGVQFLDDDDIRALIRNPEAPWPDCFDPLQMMTEDGTMCPAHLPNYYDMYGIIESSSWFNDKLASIDYSEMNTVSKVVPTFLVNIVDPLPVVDLNCPIYRLSKTTPTEAKVGYGTDALVVYHVHGLFTTIDFVVLTSRLIPEARASRFYGLRLTPTVEPNSRSLPIGTPIVMWNVRDVSRPSFVANFQSVVVDKHNPRIIILLETRATLRNWTRLYAKILKTNLQEPCLPGLASTGSIIVLWDSSVVDCETMFNSGGTSELLGLGSLKVKGQGEDGAGMSAGANEVLVMTRSNICGVKLLLCLILLWF